jgi:hypothetical protein
MVLVCARVRVCVRASTGTGLFMFMCARVQEGA